MMSESNAFDSLKLSSAVPYDHYKADVKNPPSTIIGDKHIATSPIYQEKYKHKIQEIINPDTLSKTTAYDSEVSPFSKEISSYICKFIQLKLESGSDLQTPFQIMKRAPISFISASKHQNQ